LSLALERASPRPALGRARQTLAHEAARLPGLVRSRFKAERQTLTSLAQRLDALSPLRVLGRGYAIVRREDGQVVREAKDVAVGARLNITLSRDEVEACVTGLKPGGK
jgi:exodeoxyribonuclease VII large subunit